MQNGIARFLIVIALIGCDELADEHTEGAVLATLRGTISLRPDVEPPAGELQISVLWHDPSVSSREWHEPIACDDGELTGWRLETPLLEQPVRVDTNFPSGFSVQLTEPPPAAALYAHPDQRGVSVARGDLVVYDDRNGNGRLDPSTVDEMSPDRVFGSGRGATPWGVDQRIHYSILYMAGDLEPGGGDGKAGFSVVIIEPNEAGDRTLEVKRLSDAKLELVLEPTHYVQQMACAVMCALSPTDTVEDPLTFLAGDVGTLVPSDLGVGTSVWSRQDGDATMVSLARCTKQYFDDQTKYVLDLSVMISEGCTQTGSSHALSVAVKPEDSVELPCADIRELDENSFPVEP